jgi:PAS domain S-box-containing protein
VTPPAETIPDQAEQLGRRHGKFDQIVNNSLDGIIAYDVIRDSAGKIADFRFNLVNPAAERFSSISAADLVGRTLLEKFPAAAADGLFDKYVEIVETGRQLEFEYFTMRMGSPRWFRIAGTRLGEGLAVSYTDVTPRKEAEELLHRSEERFRHFVESVEDYAIFMLDPEGHVVSWNSGAERLKGYKAEEIIGKNFSQFYLPEDAARNDPQDKLRIAARDGRFTEEGWRVRKDGSRFLANVVLTAVHDGDGKLCGFVKVTRDITEQKERTQLLEKQAADLRQALAQIKVLSGLLPICSYCSKIRDEKNQWEKVESYVARHSDANFSHGICPQCYQEHMVPQFAKWGLTSDGAGAHL